MFVLSTIELVITLILFLFLPLILGFIYYKSHLKFVSVEPNKWLLVIRDGKLVTSGVGIQTYVTYKDQVVIFPSKINKVQFSAQQVSKEMQGLEISGVIIWSIDRQDDSPFKAYRLLGVDLQRERPTESNQKLVLMSTAIIRNRIANSSIDEILKKREEVRNEIQKEINVIANSWGIMLESVEITDVRILSKTLF